MRTLAQGWLPAAKEGQARGCVTMLVAPACTGSLSALLLAKHGFKVDVYERAPVENVAGGASVGPRPITSSWRRGECLPTLPALSRHPHTHKHLTCMHRSCRTPLAGASRR